jgi:uracil-DNA glycosylase
MLANTGITVVSADHKLTNVGPNDCSLQDALLSAHHTAANCQRCALGASRTHVVFADGQPTAPLMIIGEAPGQQEDEQGLPFVGRSGQLLTQLLQTAHISRQTDTYICNMVKCRPPDNRVPTAQELEACKGYLITQMASVKPSIIVLVGATAVKGVLGLKTPISKIRGQWLPVSPSSAFATVLTPVVAHDTDSVKVMAIFHPSYLLRNQSTAAGSPRDLTLKDLQAVKQALLEANGGES